MSRTGTCFTLTAVLALVSATGVQGESITERYPGGELKARFQTNREGERHGRYVGYHENGRTKRTCTFKKGRLDGSYTEYHENGTTRVERRFKAGVPFGKATFYDEEGRTVHRVVFTEQNVYVYPEPQAREPYEAYPVAREEIERNVDALKPRNYSGGEYQGEKYSVEPVVEHPYEAGELTAEYLEDSVRQLNVYRYLCGLSHDVEIDPEYTRCAQHAAVLTAANNRIDHSPGKPKDMDAGFFEIGYKGASRSSLHVGQGSLVTALDGFMNDSDPTNIDNVGHRASCLDPLLKKTGFGEAQGYVAQWAADKSGRYQRKELIRYPAAGYFPTEYFGRRHAWSLAFGDQRSLRKIDFEITLWALDRDFRKRRRLKLDHVGVLDSRYGMGSGIVFRPVIPSGKLNGLRVQVSVRWKGAAKGKPPIDYLVHFFSLKESE